jgi:hypothetical protein
MAELSRRVGAAIRPLRLNAAPDDRAELGAAVRRAIEALNAEDVELFESCGPGRRHTAGARVAEGPSPTA